MQPDRVRLATGSETSIERELFDDEVRVLDWLIVDNPRADNPIRDEDAGDATIVAASADKRRQRRLPVPEITIALRRECRRQVVRAEFELTADFVAVDGQGCACAVVVDG